VEFDLKRAYRKRYLETEEVRLFQSPLWEKPSIRKKTQKTNKG